MLLHEMTKKLRDGKTIDERAMLVKEKKLK